MCKDYGRCCVCVCVHICLCVCVCYCASGYIPGLCVQSEAAYSFLSAFKDCIGWTSLKTFRLGDMALFACHDDQRLGSFTIKTHQWFLTQLQMTQYMNRYLEVTTI